MELTLKLTPDNELLIELIKAMEREHARREQDGQAPATTTPTAAAPATPPPTTTAPAAPAAPATPPPTTTAPAAPAAPATPPPTTTAPAAPAAPATDPGVTVEQLGLAASEFLDKDPANLTLLQEALSDLGIATIAGLSPSMLAKTAEKLREIGVAI